MRKRAAQTGVDMAELLQKHPILTLDISSSCTGMAALYRGKLRAHSIAVEGDMARLFDMGYAFKKFIYDLVQKHNFPADAYWDIWAEQPFYSRGGSHDLPIKMAHGILMFIAHDADLKFAWNYVNVNTWRAEYQLNGEKDKKTPVMKAMSEKFGIAVPNGDIGDALGILNWRMKEAGVVWRKKKK